MLSEGIKLIVNQVTYFLSRWYTIRAVTAKMHHLTHLDALMLIIFNTSAWQNAHEVGMYKKSFLRSLKFSQKRFFCTS
jgi:hypothetical protein